ncbi:hypothetical protein C1H46_045651 [Malus baccata]|uniref:Uncharacterized protein n=1 Tax=Malus baccata TaxID=106549 RepID=A0A540K3J5_MALBA|nr:hypothetical protein C1H46_045651 [Malus baccata]
MILYLSAFIWRRFTEATKDDHPIDENIFHGAFYIVNLRPRTDPPLPSCSFGNIYQIFLTTPLISSSSSSSSGVYDQESCHDMVKQVREELRKIDKDHVKRLQQGSTGVTSTDLFKGLPDQEGWLYLPTVACADFLSMILISVRGDLHGWPYFLRP